MDVKKNGNVFTVFITDATTGATAPITSFDAEVAGFPQTFTSQISLMQWCQEHGKDPNGIRFVERPQRTKPAPSAAQPKAPAQAQQRQRAEPVRDLALTHYRRVLDRHAWCAEDLKDVTAVQLEAVEELMCELWDDIEPELEKLQSRVARPRKVSSNE